MSISRNKILHSAYKIGISSNKFIELFEDSKRRNEFQENVLKTNIDPACTFRPNIKTSQERVRSRMPAKKHVCYKSFMDFRLLQGAKPKIGRPQKTSRNPQKKPIGKYLYDMASMPRKPYSRYIKEQVKAKDQKKIKKQDINKGIEQRKFHEYKQILKFLDAD